MIIGLGIDMIEVDRVQEKLDKHNGFREKIFSPSEIKFCDRQTNKSENYAARFAAKEAFLKASGYGLQLGFELADIEVIHDVLGKPSIKLAGHFVQEAVKNNWNKIHLSLSHLKSIACAVVIIEQ
ncbi:MAG: holo-ACP synthase [Chryseolinea sp.]